jgi:molybdopterin molybdotransferase
MPEFLRLLPPAEALRSWLELLPPGPLRVERLPTLEAAGRLLAEDITAGEGLPPFARSTVDGYAVRAADTHGASPTLPALLQVTGEIEMGAAAETGCPPGAALLIHTGGMIPQGADAVVMIENTQAASPGEIEVLQPAAAGQNVLQAGEDVRPGEVVLERGAVLRPQEIGGLMALGTTEVIVAGRPKVALISTGDEVVPPQALPLPGQIRDVNSYSLAALVAELGALPQPAGIIADEFEALLQAARQAHATADVVVLTAGSSVSERDMTAGVIARLGEPGVLVHGLSIRPGKPTILAIAGKVPVVGLPGNPVSALVVGRLILGPLVRRLMGAKEPLVRGHISARLTVNIPSQAGREDFIPVELQASPEGWQATPVFGRSNLIFTLVRAHAMLHIPAPVTGLAAGEMVELTLM